MDEVFMAKALELAKLGYGKVSPNPLVGAVVVKDNKIIGSGYHEKFGEKHAEVNAINSCREDVCDSTIYVTLEPCCHYGKTPPCVKKILESKIKRVVIGVLDPNPLVSGKGVEFLKNHGIDVTVGILEEQCRELNEVFNYYIVNKEPFLALKWAMTLDGKIATKNYDSKWITNEKSRKYVHKLRNRYSGIMVGINTVIKDNPRLTSRIENGRNPIRIVIDSSLRIPVDAKLLKEEGKTIIFYAEKNEEKIEALKNYNVEVVQVDKKLDKVNLKTVMNELCKRNIDSVLVEGGGTLNYSLLEEKLINRVYAFIAPKIIGGKEAITPIEGEGKSKINESFNIKNLKVLDFEGDILIEGNIQY